MSTTSHPSRESLLKSVVDCGRLFYERRWMWGTAGNLSVKLNQDPLEIAITPSGASKGELDPKDLIILKDTPPNAKSSSKKGAADPVPSAETVIHKAIHEAFPGCGAVFHVHPVHTTLISQLYGQPKQRQMLQMEWFEMMKGIGIGEGEIAEIPIFPNWQDVTSVAKEVRQYMLETPKAPPVILIYNHGVTAWGRTPEQAKNHLEIVEFICEYLILKRMAK
jgi:methylthioribulose-1-phosphate dehydratase